MIMIDDYRLAANSDAYWLYAWNLKYIKGQKDNLVLLDDAHINVHLMKAPRLVYNVATPFVPQGFPMSANTSSLNAMRAKILEILM